ncbi:hypothetical protein VTJ04DRAFT_5064 [Mycothermus thermophilus]|uniref:uncharacterized protein n=1 Tax=Humicola insolens TaxID=85995 RepID=UPI003743BAFD
MMPKHTRAKDQCIAGSVRWRRDDPSRVSVQWWYLFDPSRCLTLCIVTLVAAGHVAQDEAKISRGSIQTARPPRSACESSEMMGCDRAWILCNLVVKIFTAQKQRQKKDGWMDGIWGVHPPSTGWPHDSCGTLVAQLP